MFNTSDNDDIHFFYNESTMLNNVSLFTRLRHPYSYGAGRVLLKFVRMNLMLKFQSTLNITTISENLRRIYDTIMYVG